MSDSSPKRHPISTPDWILAYIWQADVRVPVSGRHREDVTGWAWVLQMNDTARVINGGLCASQAGARAACMDAVLELLTLEPATSEVLAA
jgi:hypothetical protein